VKTIFANPPDDPLAARGLVSIAWAVELVTDLGQIVGFLMPRLDLSQVKPIFSYYNPSMRRKDFPWFSYERLLWTAQNLATTVSSVNLRGYEIAPIAHNQKFW
jgi:DNA-binding helix-hairpin-helix protein with protein kinase domain